MTRRDKYLIDWDNGSVTPTPGDVLAELVEDDRVGFASGEEAARQIKALCSGPTGVAAPGDWFIITVPGAGDEVK